LRREELGEKEGGRKSRSESEVKARFVLIEVRGIVFYHNL